MRIPSLPPFQAFGRNLLRPRNLWAKFFKPPFRLGNFHMHGKWGEPALLSSPSSPSLISAPNTLIMNDLCAAPPPPFAHSDHLLQGAAPLKKLLFPRHDGRLGYNFPYKFNSIWLQKTVLTIHWYHLSYSTGFGRSGKSSNFISYAPHWS